jgi:hypothetical protein
MAERPVATPAGMTDHALTRTISYWSAVGGMPVSNLAFTTARRLPKRAAVAGTDRHEIELGLEGVGEPGASLGDRHVVDDGGLGVAEVVAGHSGAGPEVVHIALPGEATGDKQQVMAQVGSHAHGHAAGGASMNNSAVPRRTFPRKMSPANRSPA